MSLVPTVTAPDFQHLAKDVPRLAATAGATLELLVLAADGGQCAGVDLASGALVRAWSSEPVPEPLWPYDVVTVTVDGDPDALPDPAEPEALVLAGPPEAVHRITGRRAERLLRPLLHPVGRPLLGTHAPAVPFWERRADHPSIALVAPEGRISLWRDDGYLACRFVWQGVERELPCLDRRRAAEMDRSGRTCAIGDKGDRLVVALTPPIDGRCVKVVEGVLPRP
ncbi:MAG: hypothetical protein ACYC1D_11805 [Acidimicrobiales bacterium]